MVERLRGGAALQPSAQPLDGRAFGEALYVGLRAAYDRAHGGFGSAPKFPPASALELLLRRATPS